VRRVRGRLFGSPGAGTIQPRKAPVARLPGNPVGLPETLLGSLGPPCGPAWRRFLPRPLLAPTAALRALPSAAGRLTP